MYHHFRPFSYYRLACPEEFLLLDREHNFFLEYVHWQLSDTHNFIPLVQDQWCVFGD